MTQSASSTAADLEAPRDLPRLLLHVAWMAIGLGLALQLLISAIVALSGQAPPPLAAFIRDASQKVSWSTLVCLGVALGTSASRARAFCSGVAGLLSAPIAFVTARTVHKSVGAAVGAGGPAAIGGWAFALLLLLKGAQYAILGAALAYISRRPWGGLWAHVGVGAACGAIFGLTAMAVTLSGAAQLPPAGVVAGQALNELLFPIGCSLVVFFATRLAPLTAPPARAG